MFPRGLWPVPSKLVPPWAPWEDLALDFITRLPSSLVSIAILIVVELFSKGTHFGALPTYLSAHKIAHIFIDLVCKHHGFPRVFCWITHLVFVSNFWQQISKLNCAKLHMSITYHPQTDATTPPTIPH